MKKLIYIVLFIPIIALSQVDTTITYLEQGFESFNLGKMTSDTLLKYWGDSLHDIGWVNDSTNFIVDSTGIDGESRMWLVKFPTGTAQGQTGMEVRYSFGDRDEAYLSYQVKCIWPSGDFHIGSTGCKMLGLRGFPVWAGFLAPVSNEGFVAYLQPNNLGAGDFYMYHHSGDAHEYGFSYIWGGFRFTPNQWYTITERIVMNTFTAGVANFDGIAEGFVNGRKLAGKYDYKWMENENDTMKIDGFTMGVFMGYNEHTYSTMYLLFDNIQVYNLEETFATANGYAWGVGDTNTLGESIYVPVSNGPNTDPYDSIYTDTLWTFKDLNGIGNYDDMQDEFHKISVPGADSIVITVDTALVEDGFDIFQIINDDTHITPFYTYSAKADITEGTEYTIYNDNAIIRLGSDYSVNSKGFQITYHAYGVDRFYMYRKGVKKLTWRKGAEKKP